jgi:hypothetical protein
MTMTTSELVSHFARRAEAAATTEHEAAAQRSRDQEEMRKLGKGSVPSPYKLPGVATDYRNAALGALENGHTNVASVFAQLAISAAIEKANTA